MFPILSDTSEYSDGNTYVQIASASNPAVVIKKDNRESLNITYQTSFVGRDGVYVMPNLAERFNANSAKIASLYVLDHPITPLTTTVNLSARPADALSFGYGLGGKRKCDISASASRSGKAFVVALDNGDVLLGANLDVISGQTITLHFDFVNPKI